MVKHRYNCCTKPAPDPACVAENVLNREFHADRLNEKRATGVGEFRYVAGDDGQEGKIYLSVMPDLCDKRPAAYVYGGHNDSSLVYDTSGQAAEAAPGAAPVSHSGRGCQYTSREFRRKIADAGMTRGMPGWRVVLTTGRWKGSGAS